MLRTKALSFPKSVLIETCSLCNGGCVFCPYKKLRSTKAVQKLETEIVNRLIQEVGQHDVARITLFGNNEPLLDDRIYMFVETARKEACNAELTLSTNGRLLDTDRAMRLYEAGLDVLYVSIPTLECDAYEELMKEPLDTVLFNLAAIRQTPAWNILKIAVPITKYYDERLLDEYSRKYGIGISTWPLEYRLSWGIFDYPEQIGEKLRDYLKPCDRPLDQAVILADGEMVLCCRDWEAECSIGNIKKHSIAELWSSPRMKSFHEALQNRQYDQVYVCRDCSENPNNDDFKRWHKNA